MTGSEDARGRTVPRGRRAAPGWLFARDVLLILVAALLVSFLIKTFLIRSFYIPSQSMQNTLLVNDRIIVDELSPGLIPLKHGDVVVFQDPGGWLDADTTAAPKKPANAVGKALAFIGLSADSDDNLVKRVIGLPGDHVMCCNALGQLEVDGAPLKEPYIVNPPGTDAAYASFDIVVPKGQLWVLGDNRHNSADSSYHVAKGTDGFVPESDVVGRAIVISWPLSRWTWLSDYRTVFAGVPSR